MHLDSWSTLNLRSLTTTDRNKNQSWPKTIMHRVRKTKPKKMFPLIFTSKTNWIIRCFTIASNLQWLRANCFLPMCKSLQDRNASVKGQTKKIWRCLAVQLPCISKTTKACPPSQLSLKTRQHCQVESKIRTKARLLKTLLTPKTRSDHLNQSPRF